MSSQKTPLSSSKRAVPIKIKILNHSDRENFPYTDLEPRWSFAMPLMPLTKISELCLHAVGQVQRVFNDAVDAARLEARDRDGHVFHGMETISEEILNGETIYLIEGEGTGKGKGKERGRLLSLRTGAEQAYRTPSASSRSSSLSRKKTQSLPKPRMTPSQRALAIAKAGWTPRTEPVRGKRISTDDLGTESLPGLPSPGPSHVEPAAALPELSKQREDASDATDDAPTEPRQDISVAPSQRCSPPPETSPRLQDSQRIVPDSQDTSSRTHIQTPSASRAKLGSAFKPKRVASEPQPRSAQPLDTLNADKLQNMPSSIKTLVSRPDPYDISTVLSDDENYSPKRPNSIMFSSARKLGSASKRRPPATQPSIRQPQLKLDSPTRISKPVTTDRYDTARSMHLSNPSTPNKTSAPYKEVASSPAVALSSSPTNNVAAVIAKGRDRIMRRPIPECVVIDDSEVEIDEDLFRNPPGLSTSVPEALLPWSQPPLRATQDGTLGVRPVARGTSQSGGVGEAGTKDIVEGNNDIVESKADVRRLIDAAKETLAAVRDSNKLRARELSTGAISPLHLNSPVKGPLKSAPTTPSGKKTSEHVMNEQHTVKVIHSSTSEDENNGSDEDARIIKKEQSDDDSWKNLPPVALPSSPSPQDHGEKANEKEVIELSSDSDSSIDPAWLDDYEDELPALPELPVTEEPLLPDPASRDIELPAPTVPAQLFVTDPIEPKVNESPPSAQPDKRKRSVSDEPNSEDERQRKKAKKLKARKARKVLRKTKRRENMARMEEERKRLALEQAHRRALELEIVVSSPSKAKVVGSDDAEAESDDDSGLGLGILEADEYVEDVGVPLNGDNHDDSLSSEETGDRLAWLHRKHPTPSPETKPGSPKNSTDVVVRPESPIAEDAHAPQQHSDDLKPTGGQYHRRVFDDWAALEARLGFGGFGYSPLEVHNRIHLATVHRSLQAPLEPSRDSPDQDSSPKSPPKPAVEAHPSPPRSTRCGAPSPKDTPLAHQTASTGGRKKGGKGKKHKSQARHLHHGKRRGGFNKRRARQYYPDLRDFIDAIKKNHRGRVPVMEAKGV